ncbi:MAG: tetratricopeptide repeat protein [Gemmatimonadales bacterium]
MNPRRMITAVLALALVVVSSGYAQQTAEELYQAGLYQEEVQGDLTSAIELYERILREHPNNRPVAAMALMHIGLCHEKLGSRQAQQAYERLVHDYADQTEIVSRARMRLAALRRSVEEAEESTIVVRRLAAGDELGGPTPDGRYFALIDYSTGDVALRDLVTGEVRRLTDEGTWEPPEQYAINVSVSPDGKTAAYSWSKQDSVIELRVVGLDGSDPRVLCSNTDGVGYPMSWSWDGQHIAVPTYKSEDETGGIAWISVEDGSLRPLTALPSWEWIPSSHSPDDQFVAYQFPVEEDSGRDDVFLAATDGSGAVPLVNHPADDRLLGWLPNADQVLFLSDRSGSWDVWAVRVSEGRALGEPFAVRRGVGEVYPLGFTRDGSLFYALTTFRYAASIAPFVGQTGQIDMAASEPLLGSKVAAQWSPDENQLVFLSTETPGGYEFSLRVQNIATGEERVLAEHLIPDKPLWFPDGKSILIAARERGRSHGGTGLYRIDMTTGGATPLIEFPPDPSWWSLGNAFHMGLGGIPSPDGEGLVYVYNGRLAFRDLSSSQETELYNHPGLATRSLALSPDGAAVVFAVNDSMRPHPTTYVRNAGRLMLVSLEGGEVRELTRLSGSFGSVVWAPDGRYVFFLERRQAGAALWRVSREGGNAERVWETERAIVSFALSPDGSQAVYTIPEGESEFWVMENLMAALSEGQ